MKPPILTLLCLLGVCWSACNTTKDQVPTTPHTATVVGKTSEQSSRTQIDYESYREKFQAMSVEERWNILSPQRRNYLRENPDQYPYFKSMIARYPDMEEVSEAAQPIHQQGPQETAFMESMALKPQTHAEWWATFSETRKTYMRQHPDQYPDFKAIIESGQ